MKAQTATSDRLLKLLELEEAISLRSNTRRLSVELSEYVSFFRVEGRGRYGNLNPVVVAAEESIRSISMELSFLFNQYLTLFLIKNFKVQTVDYLLPSSIVTLYSRELQRIETQVGQLKSEFYQFSNDAFVKDLAILSHQLIPVGAEYVCPASGVPRSLLLKGGFRQFCKVVTVCLFQSGGFKPYFELHAHVLSLGDFNPDGWLETYIRLAELLEINPGYRGVMGSSWFLDPALSQISPHLAYLRTLPEENGAAVLFSSYDKAGKSGALSKSLSRRGLYEAGEYIPAIYTRIWSRSKLVDWKNRQLRNMKS